MVLLRITMKVLSEKNKELAQTLISMIGLIRKEEGCQSNAVSCDIENKNYFNLISEWETRNLLSRFIQSDRFGILLGSKTLLEEPPTIQIHTVSRSEGQEAVLKIRSKS